MTHHLPGFPWDSLADAKHRAAEHPDGLVDLSVGTPVDPTPDIARVALAQAANAPGYPTVWGTDGLHRAIIDYLHSRWQAPKLTPQSVMPVIGTKELVGWLPTLLDLGADDLVVIPTTAYPTYEVGASMAGARVINCDDPEELTERPALIWINSPANPHGATLTRFATTKWLQAARRWDSVLASDECYSEFGWESEPCSVLDVQVSDGDVTKVLAVHSLSKRSNLAGYRAGFVAGCPTLVQQLVALRKHLGMMVPTPVQQAMEVLLADQHHVERQRERYLARRQMLASALRTAGFRIDHSEGSLYLWATRGENGRKTVEWLAGLGILAAPGDFYGAAGAQYVRVSLTASDDRIAAASERLTATAG